MKPKNRFRPGDLVVNAGRLLGHGYIWRVEEVHPCNPFDENDARPMISCRNVGPLHGKPERGDVTPSNAAIFRQITDRHSAMAGVMSVPARKKCVACEKQRTVATGIESADGFVCNHCAKVRSAAQPQEGWNG